LFNGAADQPQDGPHFFAYADGTEMIRLQIASDPATSELPYANCFRDCMEFLESPLIPLPCGQIVSIRPGELDPNLLADGRFAEAGMEIIWNAEFDEDPYTGERTLLPGYDILTPQISAAQQTDHVAPVPIVGDVTDVYVRWNKFIELDTGYKRCKEADNVSAGACKTETLCGVLGSCPDFIHTYDGVDPIIAESLMVIGNKVAKLTGGGGSYGNGVPPVLVGFKEPLNIRYADVRINGINGQKAPDIVVDGVTRHTFVVEVTFSGKPVPDGTPVVLSVEETGPEGADAVVLLSSSIIYTHQTIDPLFDNSEPRSLAYFEIDPLPDTATFNAEIKATTTYDRRGDAEREVTAAIEIMNTVNDPDTDGPGPDEEPMRLHAVWNLNIYSLNSLPGHRPP